MCFFAFNLHKGKLRLVEETANLGMDGSVLQMDFSNSVLNITLVKT